MADPGQCLSGGCPNKPFRRGLCQRCYDEARKAIRGGESEEALIKKGLILRKKPTGPEMSRAFAKALAAAGGRT